MGAVVAKALAETAVSDKIVLFLDEWSTAATCDTNANDIANMADADISMMNVPWSAYVLNSTLYVDSMEKDELNLWRL